MKLVSIVLAMIIVLSALGGCSCDNSDYYSTPNVTPSQSVSSQTTSLSEIAAPQPGEDVYTMLCTFVQTAYYSDGIGNSMNTRWDMKSWYDFKAEETDGGIILKFTIARRSYTYTSNGTETVLYDTDDPATKSGDTEIFFDIIGYGFTVEYDENWTIKSVGGTKKLYSEVDGAEYLLGEPEIRAIAEELVLSLPETVKKDSAVTHSQTIDSESSMEMRYDVSRISDSILSFRMSPVSEYGLPENEIGDDYSIEYTDASDYTGSLDIMCSDRFLQSTVNTITYYSVMKVQVDSGEVFVLDGIVTATDSCEVTVKQ